MTKQYKTVTLIQIVKRICESHGALLIRIAPGFVKVKGEDWQYNCDNWHDGDFQTEDEELIDTPARNKRKGWVLLDAYTSSGLLSMYNQMNEENQKLFNRIHYIKLIDIMWSLVK